MANLLGDIMKKTVFAIAPLALAAACSGGSDSIEPGEWTLTMQMTEVTAANAPAGALEAMQSQPAQTQTQCITPAQAANPDGGLFAPQSNEDCENMDFSMSGGTISLDATCQVPGAGAMEMTMDGTYDRTTLNADLQMVMAQTPMGEMTMSGTMTGERTGDCDA